MAHGIDFGVAHTPETHETNALRRGDEATDILLSICIPTYNRARYLRAFLESAADAMPVNERRIEILISDNAGTDDTPTVIEEFRDRLPSMVYSRNRANIGAEANMLRLAAASRGTYLWLFGDDDLFNKNTLRALIPELERGADYFILNQGVLDPTGTACAVGSVYPYPDNLDLAGQDEVLSRFGLRLGLISGVIYRRAQFLAVPADEFMRHAPSGLSSFYTALMVCRNHTVGRYLAKSMLYYRPGNSDHSPNPERWTDVYGRSLRELTVDLAGQGFSPRAIKRLNRMVMLDYYLFCILGARLRGQPTLTYYKSMIKHYADTPAAWLVLATILIPGWAARLARWLWRARNRLRLSSDPAAETGAIPNPLE